MHNLRRFVTIVVVSVIVNVLIFVVLNERLNTVAKRLLHLDGTLVTRSDLLAKIGEQAADRQRSKAKARSSTGMTIISERMPAVRLYGQRVVVISASN